MAKAKRKTARTEPRVDSTSAKPWPADRVERWPLAKIQLYPKNPRTHSDAQVEQIVRSMREFGWTNPALVDEDGNLLCGHGRILAAQKLGWAEIPVMVAQGWSAAQKRAYIIADNQLAANAGWDKELLTTELGDLKALGFDLSLTGFSGSELERFMRGDAEGAEDAPEPPANPVSRPGDLWVLGNHRLLCGDCTVATDVERLVAGTKPHLMVTDPPYGVEYDPDWRNRADRANGKPYGARAVGQVANDGKVDWHEAWALFAGDVAYCWHAGRHASAVQESLGAAGLEVRSQIIWAKTRMIISRGNYHWQHEPCWYAVRKGGTAHWSGDRSQTTLWQIDHPKSETGHGTQKPIECMRRPMVNSSKPGDAVYEPFSGSGTTIIAAEITGRRCYAIEIAPPYVDVAVQRWQTFTGKAASLDGTRQTFDELAASRHSAPHKREKARKAA